MTLLYLLSAESWSAQIEMKMFCFYEYLLNMDHVNNGPGFNKSAEGQDRVTQGFCAHLLHNLQSPALYYLLSLPSLLHGALHWISHTQKLGLISITLGFGSVLKLNKG